MGSSSIVSQSASVYLRLCCGQGMVVSSQKDAVPARDLHSVSPVSSGHQDRVTVAAEL